MTDKQQIKKMGEIISRVQYLGGLETKVAKLLYDKGARILPQNAVVLTREEYEWLKDKAKELNDIYSNGFRTLAEVDKLIKQARKETAKDFIFKVESYLGYNADNETFTKKELLLILAEVAKEQFGVEVE